MAILYTTEIGKIGKPYKSMGKGERERGKGGGEKGEEKRGREREYVPCTDNM